MPDIADPSNHRNLTVVAEYNTMYLIYFSVLINMLVITGRVTGEYVFREHLGGSIKLDSPATWKDARETCHEEGGVLASPETEELLSAMTAAMRTSSPPPRVFTGIHDTYSKGNFYSLQGTPLVRMPTQLSGQFESDRAESCLVMHQDGTLAKNNCSDTLPYICYKSEPTCGTKDNDYTYNRQTGSCYKVYVTKVSWKRAFAACAAEDAHLAVVNSHTEAEVLKKLMTGPFVGINVGFLDWNNHNLWMTVDGKTLKEAGYENWEKGEPNNKSGDQLCGSLYKSGALDDVSCTNEESPYICEKKPDDSTKSKRYLQYMERCPKTRGDLCIVC